MSHFTKEAALAEQLIAGIKEHLATASSLAFAGTTYTPAQIEASLQTMITLRSAVDDARAALKAKVAAWDAQAPPLRALMGDVVAFLKVTYGNTPDVLADFGLQPKKAAAPLTVEQKAAAAAKRAATRAARHTMGARQKKAIKGGVTGVVVTAISASPSTAAVPAAPAAPATSEGVPAAAPHP